MVFLIAVLQERAKTYFPLGKSICLYVYQFGGYVLRSFLLAGYSSRGRKIRQRREED